MAGWGNAGGHTPDRRGRRSPGAVARAGEYHDHGGNTPVGGRSLRGDAGLLGRWWCTRHRDNNHEGGLDRLGGRDTHDPELRMRRLLVRDHLDNHSDHRRGGHLSGLTRPGGSPSSDHPESVDHHIACLDAGSARRGRSVMPWWRRGSYATNVPLPHSLLDKCHSGYVTPLRHFRDV